MLTKTIVAAVSSSIGLVAGHLAASLPIAVMYYVAADGPIFPAPLVALLVVVPIALFLLLIQGTVVAFELISHTTIGLALLPLGFAAGIGGGWSLYALLVAPYGAHVGWLLGLGALGAFQGALVFGSQLMISRCRLGL
ncbi:MAG: hypothetical protein A2Z30_04275 [Chloroflexi bacterium RBG_16_64_43]|nr:MAG: hypothetical protein A2Z30_04275 [Chloroflexi bacterium RBG_16_64_43]